MACITTYDSLQIVKQQSEELNKNLKDQEKLDQALEKLKLVYAKQKADVIDLPRGGTLVQTCVGNGCRVFDMHSRVVRSLRCGAGWRRPPYPCSTLRGS